MSPNRIHTIIVLLLVAITQAGFGQSSLWGSLKQGPQQVGFRSLVAMDSMRTIEDGRYRPVQASIWYPAQVRANEQMRYQDYFLLSASELSADKLAPEKENESLDSYLKLLSENGIPESASKAWLSSKCVAVREAPPASGKFPVLLVAQGMFHSAHHQAILCEFLASHGFAVVTTPSQARITGPMTSDEDVLPHAEAQASDLLYALDVAGRIINIDMRTIGLVAHSFGARSAFLIALRDPRVKALVSLDGGIANKFGKEWISRVSDFNPANFRVPVLHFYQNVDNIVVPDFELIESLRSSSRILVQMPGMRHIQFSSVGNAEAHIPGFASAADMKLIARCEAVAKYTLEFLRANMLEDRQGLNSINSPLGDMKYDESILIVKKIERKL